MSIHRQRLFVYTQTELFVFKHRQRLFVYTHRQRLFIYKYTEALFVSSRAQPEPKKCRPYDIDVDV